MAEFKVPDLPVEKPPKVETKQPNTSLNTESIKDTTNKDKRSSNGNAKLATEEQQQQNDLPYTVPTWSGPPFSSPSYNLSVIKNGVEIDTINLLKPFVTFGRLPTCDIHLEHPSVSRYHAVLQYRPKPADKTSESTLFSNNPKDVGFYLYDLGSIHGTRLNKTKIEPRCYYRVRVGQTMSFGGSSRLFILDVSICIYHYNETCL